MPLDPQAITVLKRMEDDGFRLSPEMTADEMRAHTIQTQQEAGPAEVGRVEDRVIRGPEGNDLTLRIFWPHGAGDGDRLPGVVVFFHGGGWVLGSIETHEPQVRSMVNRTGLIYVSVEYRRAPEDPYPAAVEDCYAATCWVAANAAELGADPARLAVAGDSAGGNLAAVTAMVARDRGGPPIAFQVLVYPCCDMDPDAWWSMAAHADGPLLTRAIMGWFYDHYTGDADRTDPYMAPLHASSHAGLPPALVITAEYDVLCDEAEAYAAKLAAAGCEVTCSRYDGMFHGFFGFDAEMDAAEAAQAEAAAALRTALG
ncbi:MAG: alpha/beta hydrolase [Acidimicrobiia bacterium]|nr:alpha/beta hydrolase [Acidimicrobiia bacterium]MYB25103.1 alpha/beta hydrolase [Acidimicrobiia bacterium]MYJ12982.1 alpha/beta hydrolase [Acidimicrobiia bacterium]